MSRRQEARRKLAERQWNEDIAWLLDDPRGRRIAWRLMDRAGVHGPLMTGNSQTFYAIGMRDLGLWLMGELRAVSLMNYRRMEDEVLSAQKIVEQLDQLPEDAPEA